MGIIDDLNGFVASTSCNESLASLLEEVMDKQLTEQPTPKNYYYVTHLTNPAQAFFSRAYPEVKKPKELARKLARGKQLHNFAGVWFRTLPGFIVDEGTLDGAWVDLRGIRGKIDYRVNNSIFEFKTKDSAPETPEEIFSTYPQDLEQLVFYSVIHPSNPKVNYLIFMDNSAPFKLRAFKVVTKDSGKIKSILKSRVRALDESFETKDQSKLGKCRYYESNCQFRTSNSCSCNDLIPSNIDALKRSVEITFDADFTKRLEEARDAYGTSNLISVSTRDIIAPRKQYMEEIRKLESPYKDEKEEYEACLWASIKLLEERHKIGLSKTERQTVVESQREPRLRVGFRWLKLKSSVRPEGEIVPYLRKVSNTSDPMFKKSPSAYHLAELGIVCATYGKSKGLIFVVYPKLDKLVRVFQVTYNNVNDLLRIVKEAIDKLEKAKEDEEMLALPPCPSFMNDNGKCPLMKECNSGEGIGCITSPRK